MRRLVKRMGGLNGDQRGLTAIELAVVVAILAVLAAIVAGNTTGMSTNARGASKSTDIAEVQKAVDNYKGQHPANYYPISTTQASTIAVTKTLNFFASYTTPEGAIKTFVPDFLARKAKHWDDFSNTWQIDSDGKVSNTLLDSQY